MLGQRQRVLGTLAQGRRLERHHVQAVKQIAAEIALLHGLFQIAIGGGQQPDIQLNGLGSAHAFHLALLQHAQELGLQEGRKLSDFVQENRAALGHLELALLLRDARR